MNICITPSIYTMRNTRIQNKTKTSFKSKKTFSSTTGNKTHKTPGNIKSYLLACLLTLSGIHACTNKTVTGQENIDGMHFEYFNIKPETKNTIVEPLINLKSKLNNKNDFLENIHIDITGSYSDLDNSNSFRKYIKNMPNSHNEKGSSFYSDKKLTKRIVIQESAHKDDKIYNLIKNKDYSCDHALKQSVMHEVGHQFDSYFGHNHDAKFAQKWDSIQFAREQQPDTNPYDIPSIRSEQKAKVLYDWNSGLSDKPEFHKAVLKDLKNIAMLKKNNPDSLARNINYYLNLIDLSQEITPHIVDLANNNRAEIYANLFSYALGEDDLDKAKFVANFANSWEIVKKDIKENLNIDIK